MRKVRIRVWGGDEVLATFTYSTADEAVEYLDALDCVDHGYTISWERI